MHVAVAVGTMLLGSWVLGAPTDEEGVMPEELQLQTQGTNTRPPTPYMSTPRPTRADRLQGRKMAGAAGDKQDQDAVQKQAISRAARLMQPIPVAPTDPNALQTTSEGASTMGMSNRVASQGPGAYATPGAPLPPTQRQSFSGGTDNRPLVRNILDQTRGSAFLSNSGGAMQDQVPAKAFAGFRPTSGVSPYMNLFRTQGDLLDNYTSLVRPAIEQRFLNQQFNRDLRGLENNSRTQGVNLQQLYRSNQTLQGVETPQFYMNYQSYYPGSGQ